jgi:hypothetical protein
MKELKGKKNLVGCEIGVKSGRHARMILEFLDIKRLYLIDPWDFFPERFVLEGRAKKGQFSFCKKVLRPWNKKIQYYIEFSEDAYIHFKDESLDFVYIDGNHEPEYVKKDIELYWSKLKVGGLMAGHDFMAPRWQGVIDAVNEAFGDNYETGQTVARKGNNMEWWTWKQYS